MGGTGKVRVSVRAREKVGAASPNDPPEWVEINVRDQGPGIAPHVLDKLFVPFFTTKPTGTGLGLAVSQRVVEEMGGRIEVTSHPGAGSTFTVVLPTASEPLPPARSGSERGVATGELQVRPAE
jgi:signal transduction histidine kinase